LGDFLPVYSDEVKNLLPFADHATGAAKWMSRFFFSFPKTPLTFERAPAIAGLPLFARRGMPCDCKSTDVSAHSNVTRRGAPSLQL
jgi:hypothetical protein